MNAPLAERTGDAATHQPARPLSISPRSAALSNEAGLRLVGRSADDEHADTSVAPSLLQDLHEHLRVGAHMLKALQSQIAHAERVLGDLERKRRGEAE